MFETLRSHLLTTTAAYAAATGKNPPAIGKLALNDHGFFRRVEAREGFTVKSYDKAMTWLDEHWPEDLDWPIGVPRPRQEASDQTVCHAA